MSDRGQYRDAILRQNFPAFLRRCFRTLCPDDEFGAGWHLEAIANQLVRAAAGTERRLLITMPPRSLKSMTISVAYVAWMLGRNPALRFVCASYSAELASKLARDCRAIMRSDWYCRIFPGVVFAREAEQDIETTLGGGRFSTSVGGTLTGRGADFLIIDDPIKPEDAHSEAARRAVKEWFSGTLMSRLNNKKSGVIILVMQRLHQDDLAGHVLEAGGWTHLNLPAIALDDELIPIGKDRFHHRRAGDLLQPEREPMPVLDQLRRDMGSAAFEAQYQQSPMPAEGLYVKKPWLGTYEAPLVPQAGDMIVQAWDTATKIGDGNDWSVGVTAVVRKKQVFIIDVYRARLAFPDLRRAVEDLARRHRAKYLLIEDAASGAQLIQQLRHDQPQGVPRPIACKTDKDKITRLAACTPFIEAGGLLLPATAPWLNDFVAEVLGFPNAKHDDQVDALTYLLMWVQNRPSVPPVLPWVCINPNPIVPGGHRPISESMRRGY